MDINQIRYFLNLSETLNFTDAARLSGISQPSLTKSIQRLEEELGGALVYRDGKDTRLTPLGRELQVEFMRVRANLNTISELAENSVLGKQRRLNIGVAATIAPHFFASFWKTVLSQLPSIELHLHTLLPNESELEVLSGKYDMCLLTSPPEPNFKLTILPLFKEELRLAVAQTSPLAALPEISAEHMAQEPYIDRLNCEFRTQLIQHFMDRNIVMRPRFLSEREDWVQHMVAADAGICALPQYSATIAGVALRPVTGMALSRQPALIAISGGGNPKEVRQILGMAATFDWLAEATKQP